MEDARLLSLFYLFMIDDWGPKTQEVKDNKLSCQPGKELHLRIRSNTFGSKAIFLGTKIQINKISNELCYKYL